MKQKKAKDAKVHADLGSIDVTVTKFGEIGGNLDIDKINEFLNDNVDDKKLTKDQQKPSNK